MDEALIVQALERGVRAEESARGAHHRLDTINGQIARNAEVMGQFKQRVSDEIAAVQRRISEESTETRALISSLQLELKPLLVKMAIIGMIAAALITLLIALVVRFVFA